jgi:ABC-type multidrug transport system ATPase subunit
MICSDLIGFFFLLDLQGPSGAGKSTLLDLLANRKQSGIWCGDILVNQRPRSAFFHRDSAYVLQDDLHLATLTVRETLYYAAWVKLPEGTSEVAREKRVDFLLKMMGLEHVHDSPVGDAMQKVCLVLCLSGSLSRSSSVCVSAFFCVNNVIML